MCERACPAHHFGMNTIHGTGHRRLPDGSLLRVDIEIGHWVGRLYTPDLHVKTRITGRGAEVHAWADRITEAVAKETN